MKTPIFHINFSECQAEGPLRPQVVNSTAQASWFTASNVLILGEKDEEAAGSIYNFWLAEQGKTTGQGFTLKLDNCTRLIAGCQIKNLGNEAWKHGTREFKVMGSLNQSGPWETLLEKELNDTRLKPASLLNFFFEEPVEIQFLKFELISYWGDKGGGLQFFAAIPATMTDTAIIRNSADGDVTNNL